MCRDGFLATLCFKIYVVLCCFFFEVSVFARLYQCFDRYFRFSRCVVSVRRVRCREDLSRVAAA